MSTSDLSDMERVREAVRNLRRGDDTGDRLAIDPETRTLRLTSEIRDPDATVVAKPEDIQVSGR